MMNIRNATKKDAGALAYLINLAGEGIPEYFWKTMVTEGESPLAVGASRAMRDDGNFTYKNAKVCIENAQVAGMILSYKLPDPYLPGDLAEYPELVHPLIRLETQVPGSWYINAVKLYEQLGFIKVSALPVILYEGCMHGGEWILMTRDISII